METFSLPVPALGIRDAGRSGMRDNPGCRMIWDAGRSRAPIAQENAPAARMGQSGEGIVSKVYSW